MSVNPVNLHLDETDRRLITAVQGGLPLVSRPYAEIGRQIGLDESEVIRRMTRLQQAGAIKRTGIVVRHHELGYRSNAMVVWDIPDELIRRLGPCMGQYPFVTLCYQRPRRLPDWPYNLFTMIHGKDQASVMTNIDRLVEECGLEGMAHDVLFSGRRFKQRGARYFDVNEADSSRKRDGHAE